MQPSGATALPSVLVVDDREDVAMALVELCRAFGHPAVIGERGRGMSDLLACHAPGCVIVDVMMPGEDGYEALREIARYDTALPVLLITGHGDDWLRMGETLGRAHGLRFVRTAAKPVRGSAIRAFLDAVTAAAPPEGRGAGGD